MCGQWNRPGTRFIIGKFLIPGITCTLADTTLAIVLLVQLLVTVIPVANLAAEAVVKTCGMDIVTKHLATADVAQKFIHVITGFNHLVAKVRVIVGLVANRIHVAIAVVVTILIGTIAVLAAILARVASDSLFADWGIGIEAVGATHVAASHAVAVIQRKSSI